MPIFSQTIQELASNKMPQPYYRLIENTITTAQSSFFPTGAAPRSISAWINPTNYVSTDYANICGYGADTTSDLFVMVFRSAGTLGLWGSSDNYDSGIAVELNKWQHVVVTYDGTNIIGYVDGVQGTTTAKSYTTTESAFVIGSGPTGAYQNFEGSISEVNVWNKALTATEVKELYSGASVPFKYKGANPTELTSGTLTIGKKYRINNWITNDDFTNIGGTNEDGNEFVATGTTPTTWTNSSTVVPIGAVAEYDGSGVASDKWLDKSGNDLHGTITAGATAPTVENAPSGDDGLVYEEGEFDIGYTDDGGDLVVNASYNVGAYTRIGRVVHAQGNIRFASGTASGDFILTGLPYTTPDFTDKAEASAASIYMVALASAIDGYVGGYISGTSIYLRENGTTGNGEDLGVHIDAQTTIDFQATYMID